MAEVDIRRSEVDLIVRSQHGDLSAFDSLVNIHASRVFNIAYRMLGSRQDAEDAAQDAFLKAFSAIKKFRKGSTFSTWLYRITTNVCLDELKRRPRRPRPISSLTNSEKGEDSEDFIDKITAPAQGQDPSDIVVERAAQQKVEAALANLPDQQRAVIVMCDIEELSYEEAAKALDVSVGTIKSRLHRARQRLKQLLDPKRELMCE